MKILDPRLLQYAYNLLCSLCSVAYRRTGHSGHALSLWIWGAHAEPPNKKKLSKIQINNDNKIVHIKGKKCSSQGLCNDLIIRNHVGSFPDIKRHPYIRWRHPSIRWQRLLRHDGAHPATDGAHPDCDGAHSAGDDIRSAGDGASVTRGGALWRRPSICGRRPHS